MHKLKFEDRLILLASILALLKVKRLRWTDLSKSVVSRGYCQSSFNSALNFLKRGGYVIKGSGQRGVYKLTVKGEALLSSLCAVSREASSKWMKKQA